MDGFNGKEFYGFSFSQDPKLRTTTRNYEFKYNSSDHLDKVINRVRLDRQKKLEMEQQNAANKKNIKLQNSFPKSDKAILAKIPNIETRIGCSRSNEAVVKIMSDREIEDMLSNAGSIPSKNLESISKLSSWGMMHSTVCKNSLESLSNERVLSVEIFPEPKPQWVEIKPVQVSTSTIFEIPSTVPHGSERTYSEEFSDLYIKEQKSKASHKSPDRSSVGSKVTHELSTNNPYSDYENPDNDNSEDLDSLNSLDMDSNLNDSEHLEVGRVFDKLVTGSAKDPYEYNEYSDEEFEKIDDVLIPDNTSCASDDFEPRIQKPSIDLAPKQNSLSYRSAQSTISTISTIDPKSSNNNTKICKASTKSIIEDPKLEMTINELKNEKLRIFSKMTAIQEKMIRSLDDLRMTVVEITIPDGEVEQKAREKNVLEFAVRFSRNYLFPLGKMIEDIRASPKEEYCSALTNEACVKVCGIYGLLGQAVQCYHKQLRHLYNDCVPRKLETLLKMIKETTEVCLQKEIFDKRDSVVRTLILRCDMFLGYIFEVAQKKAKHEEAIQKSDRKKRFKLPKTSSKYDLTMSLNKLNMYEPKLIAKKPAKVPHPKKHTKSDRKSSAKHKSKTTTLFSKQSEYNEFPTDDLVETQVRKDATVESSQLINEAVADERANEIAGKENDAEDVFDLCDLDSVLKSSDNPQSAVQSVINVLKTKFEEAKGGKELKYDEIAAEIIITQNSYNSYQREAYRKGSMTNRSMHQKQLNQHGRQNKIPKLKTKLTSTNSKNVKEDVPAQTERYSRNELVNYNKRNTNAIGAKQSASNIDFVGADFSSENNLMKKRTYSGVFHSATSTIQPETADTAKKLTPVSNTNEYRGIATTAAAAAAVGAAPRPLRKSLVTVNDVMPPPPLSTGFMPTDKGLDYNVPTLMGLHHRSDKFGYVNDYHSNLRNKNNFGMGDMTSQRSVRNGAANAYDRESTQNEQESIEAAAEAKTSSPVKNETISSEFGKIYYKSNALYTFVRYIEDNLSPPANEEEIAENSATDINTTENVASNETEMKNTEKIENNISQAKANVEKILYDIIENDINIKSSNEEIGVSPNKMTFNKVITLKDIPEEITKIADMTPILEERDKFIEKCKHDPFYNNSQYPQPWRVLSKISNVLAREVVEKFEEDLSFGEETFIRDFIDMEVQT